MIDVVGNRTSATHTTVRGIYQTLSPKAYHNLIGIVYFGGLSWSELSKRVSGLLNWEVLLTCPINVVLLP